MSRGGGSQPRFTIGRNRLRDIRTKGNQMQTMTTIENVIRDAIKGRKVIVLRGVSGSGKSTIAQRIFDAAAAKGEEQHAAIVSADQYFIDADGVYRFDPSMLGEAHGECLRTFTDLLTTLDESIKEAVIIVDNTNTTTVECAPYMALASAYGWRASMVTIDIDPRKAALRNVHGVSEETVDAQFTRIKYDDAKLPPFWDCITLYPGSTLPKVVRAVPSVEQEVR